jgi:hypothetical protein
MERRLASIDAEAEDGMNGRWWMMVGLGNLGGWAGRAGSAVMG